jgi:hypothetical protein
MQWGGTEVEIEVYEEEEPPVDEWEWLEEMVDKWLEWLFQ